MKARHAWIAAPLVAGCVTAEWTTWRAHDELAPAPAGLHPGTADLEGCLDVLGAPLDVREYADGAVLAWGWARERRFGVTVSVPYGDEAASVTVQRARFGLTGLVLFFDREWRLTEIRRGRLDELLPDEPRRVQLVED